MAGDRFNSLCECAGRPFTGTHHHPKRARFIPNE